MTDQALKAAVERVTDRADARELSAKVEAMNMVPTGQKAKYVADVLASAEVVISYADLRTLLAALSSQASVMEEMARGLESFDATSAMCPFNRSPTPPKDKPCPTCGAEKSEGCRREITGAFGLVYTVRTALSQYRTLGDRHDD